MFEISEIQKSARAYSATVSRNVAVTANARGVALEIGDEALTVAQLDRFGRILGTAPAT
jgi:hypothetical protein